MILKFWINGNILMIYKSSFGTEYHWEPIHYEKNMQMQMQIVQNLKKK